MVLQGLDASPLEFKRVQLVESPFGDFSGIGVFAGGLLEAVYTGMALNAWQLRARTVSANSAAVDDLSPILL